MVAVLAMLMKDASAVCINFGMFTLNALSNKRMMELLPPWFVTYF
tara:strand:+ start:1304 stop:1438 length:135 start_codon:yes stop_codon:yes gene_type:complete